MTASGLGCAGPEQERDLLRALAGVGVARGQGVDTLAGKVVAVFASLTTMDSALLHVMDERTRRLTVPGGGEEHELDEGVAGWVASHVRPLAIADARADPRCDGDFRSVLAVPAPAGGMLPAGVVELRSRTARDFGVEEVELMRSAGALVGVALARCRLEALLDERRALGERVAAQAVAAQEAELRRIAADIHDGISQRIVSLSYQLVAASDLLPHQPAIAAERVASARALADDAQRETRAAIGGLRPPALDDLGLAASLRSLGRSIDGPVVQVRADTTALPGHVETALYRIAQEALQNVAKHAQAETVQLELSTSPALARLRVMDDGVGFDLAGAETGSAEHYGLRGMDERAQLVGGRLHVSSMAGRGTTVLVTVPLDPR